MQKIMFNDKYGLTKAVLDGRKTMTRRICFNKATKEPILADDVQSYLFYSDENILEFVMNDGSIKVAVPQLKVGEVVAIAQSYLNCGYSKEWVMGNIKPSTKNNPTLLLKERYPGWTNKMFVKPDLMPHHIRITDIRAERLQDISDEDCLKEGITTNDVLYYILGEGIDPYPDARTAFETLLDKVNSKGTWESNPYVFVYEFKLID